jgi:hypothetical protein
VLQAGPAIALPGQTPAQVVQEANQKGWKITQTEFKPSIYGFGRESDWKRVEGRTVGEHRSFRIWVDEELHVKKEFLDYSVDVAYADEDLKTADALWQDYVREFYSPEIAKEILEGQPVRRIIARTGKGKNYRNRVAVILGKEWLYKTKITETYTDGDLSTLQPDSRIEYDVHICDKSNLEEELRDLRGYNWLIYDSNPHASKSRRP